MSGSELAYGAIGFSSSGFSFTTPAVVTTVAGLVMILRVRAYYAVILSQLTMLGASTDIAYGASYAMRSTAVSYGSMRCTALIQRMVLPAWTVRQGL